MNDTRETAVLAGGCFWGMQDLIRKRPGVISTRVGYTGGDVANATYRNHDGHAEAIEIVFDPDRVSYRELLEFFFQIHDPTTQDRQGNDVGSSYRSEIFYTSEAQRSIAEKTIADVDASGVWPGKVVTELSPAGRFWEAEPEHQDYLERFPNGYTCHFVRDEWKLPHRSERLTSQSVDTAMAVRDDHLRSEEFFDVERHPKISFRSKGAMVLTAGRYTVNGELTIRGITQPVRLVVDVFGRAPDVQGNPRPGLKATAKVQRALWGITWNAPVPGGGVALAEEVDLELDVSLVRAGPAAQAS